MPRVAEGELETLSDGRFAARITIEGKNRKSFTLVHCTTEPEARERCKAMAGIASRLRKAGLVSDILPTLELAATRRPGPQWEKFLGEAAPLLAGETEKVGARVVPTFEAWAKEWTSGRLHAKFPDQVSKKDSTDDVARLRNYLVAHLGPMRLDEITLADCDEVMGELPAEMEASSRRHVAQTIQRTLKLAVYPGGYLKSSPVPSGWLPKPGKKKARSYIYPDEDRALMAASAEKVPLWRRLLWGFMCREGTRGPSEAMAFRWRHFDLARGSVRLDANKTDDPRVWTLSPGVARALRAWKERSKHSEPGDLVFVDESGHQPHVLHLADHLRADLKKAGITRPELFEHNAHRIMLRAHDCRASFITVALATGKSETWVTDRTGHTTSQQLVNYRRAARTAEELHLGDWTPLDEAIPELRDPSSSPVDCPPSDQAPPESGQVGDENLGESASPEETSEDCRNGGKLGAGGGRVKVHDRHERAAQLGTVEQGVHEELCRGCTSGVQRVHGEGRGCVI